MSRIVYVNGAYLPEEEAKVSIFDRGFLMSDAVYEVTSVLGGKLIDFAGHATRLARSLNELDLAAPRPDDAPLALHRDLTARNHPDAGVLHLQVPPGTPGDTPTLGGRRRDAHQRLPYRADPK